MSSDKENEQPSTRANTPTPRPSEKRGLRGASARMPTPSSGSTAGGSGNKRRRTGQYSMSGGGGGIYEDEPEEEEEEDGAEVPGEQATLESDEDDNLRFYNPNQDPEKRRRLRATIRDHSRMVDGESDMFVS